MATSSIIAKIGLNSAGFKTGLAQCKAMAGSFKASVGGMFAGVGGQMLGALGLSAGVAGLGALTMKTIETGGAIEDMAFRTRMGKEEYQALAIAAKEAGLQERRLVDSVDKINIRTQDAIDGNKKYQESFARLGISLNEFANLSSDQRLQKLGEAYLKGGESLQSLNDISAILGQRTGPQMIEMLRVLATEGMDNLTSSALEAGRIMDEETLASLGRAGDEIDRWQNKIIVLFGGFLADMGSSIGRQKWGLMIGLKFAQAGEFIENTFRSISNYILGTFTTIFRYLNSQFAGFIAPIRNVFTDFLMTMGGALSKFVGLFSDSFKLAIDRSINSLDKMRDEMNNLAKADKNKSFGDLFGEEMAFAENQNIARKNNRGNLSSSSVDWYKAEIARAEKLRDIEKQRHKDDEQARKAKYQQVKSEKKESSNISKTSKKSKSYNDSYLARIGGGGNIATRFDTNEKQLSESKKHSKLLEKIAENTANNTNPNNQLLMK